MTVRIFFTGERVGPQLARYAQKNTKKMLAAERGASQDVIDYVVPRARADIRQAGKFGARWSDGFRGRTTEGGGFIRVSFTMPSEPPMKWWRTHQFGAVISGRPLLWIPLSFAKDAQGVRARDYPGKLFRVDRRDGKAPLLMASKGGGEAEAKYFGKASVRVPKRFHLIEIIAAGAKQMKKFYSERIKNG